MRTLRRGPVPTSLAGHPAELGSFAQNAIARNWVRSRKNGLSTTIWSRPTPSSSARSKKPIAIGFVRANRPERDWVRSRKMPSRVIGFVRAISCWRTPRQDGSFLRSPNFQGTAWIGGARTAIVDRGRADAEVYDVAGMVRLGRCNRTGRHSPIFPEDRDVPDNVPHSALTQESSCQARPNLLKFGFT